MQPETPLRVEQEVLSAVRHTTPTRMLEKETTTIRKHHNNTVRLFSVSISFGSNGVFLFIAALRHFQGIYADLLSRNRVLQLQFYQLFGKSWDKGSTATGGRRRSSADNASPANNSKEKDAKYRVTANSN
jgi:hypothetical protein